MPSEIEYPTPEEVLNSILSNLRWSYDRAGIEINVSKGTEPYLRMKAIASRISIAINNNKLSVSAISPLDAQGDDLIELAGVFGVYKRPASAASGNVIVGVIGAVPVTIPSGFKCTAPNGITYETTSAYTVSNDSVIQVAAISTGSDTDQSAGTIMKWDSAALALLDQECVVDSGAIDGGTDEDDDERLRERLLRKLGFPAVGGNWSHVITLAEDATSSVHAAFVYPAIRGPASYDVAVIGSGGDRVLSNVIVNNVASYILSNMPGSADLNATSAVTEELDVILNLSIPLPIDAGGAGGGWRDSDPWPSTSESGIKAKVTSVANILNDEITVDSTSADPPKPGDRFGIWNPIGGTDSLGDMHEFTILSVGGSSGAYTVVIDTTESDAISFIDVGMYCSPGAIKLKDYGVDFLNAMRELGPGEKSTNVDIVPRGARKPGPDTDWPYRLTSIIKGRVANSNQEVLDISYAARYATGTSTTQTDPTIPSTTHDEPRILKLKHLAFRRQV